MAQSLSNILVHIIFSTKNRHPFIQKDIEERLYQYISAICNNQKCPIHQINGMADHIHILLSLGRMACVSKLVGDIKAYSSRWIKEQGKDYEKFAWQNGYCGLSIGQSGFDNAVEYISNQKEHHKVMTFKEEYIQFLKKYHIEFDEKYLWD
jgi:REP element-mobilizing transposase RayT